MYLCSRITFAVELRLKLTHRDTITNFGCASTRVACSRPLRSRTVVETVCVVFGSSILVLKYRSFHSDVPSLLRLHCSDPTFTPKRARPATPTVTLVSPSAGPTCPTLTDCGHPRSCRCTTRHRRRRRPSNRRTHRTITRRSRTRRSTTTPPPASSAARTRRCSTGLPPPHLRAEEGHDQHARRNEGAREAAAQP